MDVALTDQLIEFSATLSYRDIEVSEQAIAIVNLGQEVRVVWFELKGWILLVMLK